MRDQVEENLPSELVSRVHSLMESDLPEHILRERLIHVLTRYERYKTYAISEQADLKKTKLKKIERASRRLNEVANSEFLDEYRRQEKELGFDPTWKIENAEDAPSLEKAILAVVSASNNLLAACALEHEQIALDRKSRLAGRNVALDQFIADLAGTFDHFSTKPAETQCYFTGQTGGYQGAFFEVVRVVLDSYDPRSYFSEGALGKRIQRVLTSE